MVLPWRIQYRTDEVDSSGNVAKLRALKPCIRSPFNRLTNFVRLLLLLGFCGLIFPILKTQLTNFAGLRGGSWICQDTSPSGMMCPEQNRANGAMFGQEKIMRQTDDR